MPLCPLSENSFVAVEDGVCLTVISFEQKECESDSSGAGRRLHD